MMNQYCFKTSLFDGSGEALLCSLIRQYVTCPSAIL